MKTRLSTKLGLIIIGGIYFSFFGRGDLFVQAQDQEAAAQEQQESPSEPQQDAPAPNESQEVQEEPTTESIDIPQDSVIVAEPQDQETVVVDIDTQVPNDESGTPESNPTPEDNTLSSDLNSGETVIGTIDGEIATENPLVEGEETPLDPTEEIPLSEEELLALEEIPLVEEILPEIIEEPDTEVYLTAEDIQAHLDFVKSLPKISTENTIKDISKQDFSECIIDTPAIEMTENTDKVIDLDISSLENKNTFDFGINPFGIDLVVETSSFIKDLFKEEKATLVVNTDEETQKGIFSVPVLSTDKESKEKSLCQITVVSE